MSKADDLILANGPYPPMPAVERRLVGLAHHPTIWEVAAPMIATLPNGSRVALPAGTVLREGSGGIDSAHLLACARGVVDFATQEPIDGPLMRALLSALRAACGDSLEDVAMRVGPPRPPPPGREDAARITAQEGAARDAARLGRPA